MNLIKINEKERKIILEWAKTYCDDKMIKSQKNKSSYFLPVNEDNNAMIYDWESMSEFKNMLEGIWGGDLVMNKIILPCAVATMKGIIESKKIDVHSSCCLNNKKNGLADYIYEF